jgi:hypothetical protein
MVSGYNVLNHHSYGFLLLSGWRSFPGAEMTGIKNSFFFSPYSPSSAFKGQKYALRIVNVKLLRVTHVFQRS